MLPTMLFHWLSSAVSAYGFTVVLTFIYLGYALVSCLGHDRPGIETLLMLYSRQDYASILHLRQDYASNWGPDMLALTPAEAAKLCFQAARLWVK